MPASCDVVMSCCNAASSIQVVSETTTQARSDNFLTKSLKKTPESQCTVTMRLAHGLVSRCCACQGLQHTGWTAANVLGQDNFFEVGQVAHGFPIVVASSFSTAVLSNSLNRKSP
jgi:hypothetical protein